MIGQKHLAMVDYLNQHTSGISLPTDRGLGW